MEHRSLLVVCFYFYQNLRVVPHGMKCTSPEFVTRPVYLRSQLRNNTNTVSTLVLLIHLLHVLCTRYADIAHHRALQTSRPGWADSKAVHGMECSGVRSLYWRSLSAGVCSFCWNFDNFPVNSQKLEVQAPENIELKNWFPTWHLFHFFSLFTCGYFTTLSQSSSTSSSKCSAFLKIDFYK